MYKTSVIISEESRLMDIINDNKLMFLQLADYLL